MHPSIFEVPHLDTLIDISDIPDITVEEKAFELNSMKLGKDNITAVLLAAGEIFIKLLSNCLYNSHKRKKYPSSTAK